MPNPFAALSSRRRDERVAAALADICRDNADALAEFERAYQMGYADTETDSVIGGRSKAQADADSASGGMDGDLEALCARIAHDLAAATDVITVDTASEATVDLRRRALPAGDADAVRAAMGYPEGIRPQLTATASVSEMPANSATEALLGLVAQIAAEPDPRKKMLPYHLFRQGLDILDVEPVTYGMILRNIASIEHWLPALANAVRDSGAALRIPRTKVAICPMPLLELTRLDYGLLSPATKRVVDLWATEAFGVADTDDLFVRTGTASSKFDFRNARVRGTELADLGEYLLYVHGLQIQMAGPLNNRSVYGMGTTAAWAVRDWVAPTRDLGCIYHGMPLRPELRVFVDCDVDAVIASSDYWRRDVMVARLAELTHGHDLHDYVVFEAAIDELERICEDARERVETEVAKLLPSLGLSGTWSLDVMVEENALWAIDMAPATNSALADVCPKGSLRPAPEPWLPVWPADQLTD